MNTPLRIPPPESHRPAARRLGRGPVTEHSRRLPNSLAVDAVEYRNDGLRGGARDPVATGIRRPMPHRVSSGRPTCTPPEIDSPSSCSHRSALSTPVSTGPAACSRLRWSRHACRRLPTNSRRRRFSSRSRSLWFICPASGESRKALASAKMASAASATAPDAEPPSAVRPTAGRTSCTPNLRFETRIIAAAADRFIFLPTARYQNAARMSRGSGRRRQTTVRWLPARQVTRTGVWAGVAWRCPPENGAGRDSTAEKRPQNGQKIVYAEEPHPDPMGQRHFAHGVRVARLFSSPRPERRTKTMHGRFQPGGRQHPRQVVTDGPARFRLRGEDVAGRTVQAAYDIQRRDSRIGQRHPVLDAALHPLGRDTPFSRVCIDLVPGSESGLARPDAGQSQEPQARAHGQRCRGAVDSLQGVGNVTVVERPEVSLDRWHGRQGAVDGLAGRVVLDVAVGLAPCERRPDGAAELPGGRGFRRPDGIQHGEHVGAVDAVDPPLADARERVSLQRGQPRGGRRLAQPGVVCFVRLAGGAAEGRYLRLAPDVRQRIPATAGEPSIFICPVACFGKCRCAHATQPEIMTPAGDHEPLNPRLRTGGRDHEEQRLVGAVPSGSLQRLHLGGRHQVSHTHNHTTLAAGTWRPVVAQGER